VLFIFELAGGIVLNIATAASGAAAVYTMGIGVGAFFGIAIISWVYVIAMIVLTICGLINAAKGDEKPLPIIGGIQILK
jgi:hypothetical protein